MRILMLTQYYAPTLGGEERHVQTLSRALVARGHTVAVATLWHTGLPDFEIDDGVRVHRLRGSIQSIGRLYAEGGRRHAPPLPDPEIVLGLRRLVTEYAPEIVHAHNWLIYSYLPLKTWSGARLVCSAHDYSLVCPTKNLVRNDMNCSGPSLAGCLSCGSRHYGPIKGAATVLGHRAMATVTRHSVDMFVPVSTAVADGNNLHHTGVPYRVIPNFLPHTMEESQPGVVEEYTRQLPRGDFLLFVGDLRRFKGIHFLLEAYASVRGAPPLVLIGRKCRDTPALLPDNVHHLGMWPHAAVMQAWRRCLFGLVPSVGNEPFGIVALEAMQCGKPVIASRIGGLADVVTHGETGLLVPPGDCRALTSAIERLLLDPDLRGRMGRAAALRTAEFSAGSVVPRIEALYTELLA